MNAGQLSQNTSTLGQHFVIDSGKSPVCQKRPALPGEWGVLKLGAVSSGVFVPEENKALKPGTKIHSALEIANGDLLFIRKNTYDLVGTVVIATEPPPRLLLPDLIFRLRPTDGKCHLPFVARLLSTRIYREKLKKLASGTSGSMPNISKARLAKLEISVPPLDEQRRIADILDRAEALRAQRRAALALLDDLTQAIFLDMFGDPITNPMAWDTRPLLEVCDAHSGGTPSKEIAKYWEGEIPWFSPKDLKQDHLELANHHLSEEAVRRARLRLFPIGTVLIVVRGMILAHSFPVSSLRCTAPPKLDTLTG